ncbi:MAG: TonB-dependent receptor [Williamsia sp.]|nr:TonB-dependent receptor [Williamsia sp.]
MYKTLLLLLFATIAQQLSAQKISGTIKDEQGKPMPGASITLKKSKDSVIVKLQVTDNAGQYHFADIQPGSYFINSSFAGYASANSGAFQVKEGEAATSVPSITLSKLTGNLKEVVVAAKKPMIEIKADKTILNVEGSVNAVGQDALELLRKSPGVLVDKDENLSLSGKSGVQVYIDGRPTPLSGADLASYLKTLQSSSIEAIEIITNPSAKYDAAGNAGIINIRLKKNKSYGTNGSVNANYAIGIYSKYIAGFSLNNRNRFVNLFGNYNYNQSRNESYMSLYRTVFDTLFDQHSTMRFTNNSHNFKAGFDYTINRKSTVGMMVNGNLGDNSLSNNSRTPISYIPAKQVNRILTANNSSQSKRNNVNVNANYRYADTAGHELNIDADYGLYRIKSDQYQPNFYYGPTGNNLLESRIYNMLAPTDIDIYTFKTDYEQNFKKGRLGFGGKISYVNSANDFQRFNVITSYKTLDTLRSNRFDYKENINALYANYNKQFKGFIVQAGVRMENTHAEGTSNGFRRNSQQYQVYDSSFKRNYTDFFPSAAITFNKKPMNQFGIQYSRRIDRPAYQDLNPFEFKLDEYTFQKGNTQLRPQYTNSVSLTHMYKFKLNTKLTYSHVKDVFTQLTDTAERSKAFLTKKNLATQDIVSLNISYPFQYKWYTVFSNINTYYSHYKANFGTGRTVDLDVYSVNIYQQHTVAFKKGWTGEMTLFYTSPSIWQGTFKSKEMFGLDAGLLKTVMQGKATVKASVSDIFHTMTWSGISNFAGQYMRVGGGWESRQLKLNFTYRFGSNQVKAARQRKTGLDEENNRVGSQGGGIGN